MEDQIYKWVTEECCPDGVYFENICFDVRRDMFRSDKRDFGLIAFGPAKIVFFAAIGDEVDDSGVALQLRGALNFLASKLCESVHSFVVCGLSNEKYFYFNQFSDRLLAWNKDDEGVCGVQACIENDFIHSPEIFDYASMLRFSDVLALAACNRKGRGREKVRVSADGTVYVYKGGVWREASEMDAETLYYLTALGGMLGLHLFYQQKRGKGVLYLLTLGLFGVGWFFDSLEILFGIYRDPKGRYLVPVQNKLFGLLVLLGGAALFGILLVAATFLVRFLSETFSGGLVPLFEELECIIEEEI